MQRVLLAAKSLREFLHDVVDKGLVRLTFVELLRQDELQTLQDVLLPVVVLVVVGMSYHTTTQLQVLTSTLHKIRNVA